MLGFYIDILKLPRGTHRIWFYQYFASPFEHGDEKKFNDILDNPLRVTVLAASLPKKGAARGDEGKLETPASMTSRRTLW